MPMTEGLDTAEAKLASLDPEFRRRVINTLAMLPRGSYYLNNGWRHPATQRGFVASGRSKATWSFHNRMRLGSDGRLYAAAYALDINPVGAPSLDQQAAFYRRLRDAARANGLESGADYKQYDRYGNPTSKWTAYGLGWDPLHIEMPASADREREATEAATLTALVTTWEEAQDAAAQDQAPVVADNEAIILAGGIEAVNEGTAAQAQAPVWLEGRSLPVALVTGSDLGPVSRATLAAHDYTPDFVNAYIDIDDYLPTSTPTIVADGKEDDVLPVVSMVLLLGVVAILNAR